LVSSNLYARCVCVPIFCALLWHFPFSNLVWVLNCQSTFSLLMLDNSPL
jgi:maltodextrin utilization protein YvdJ